MILHLAIALQAQAAQPRPPRRDIDDPGEVVSEQRVAPAGVQSVFDGRVYGVKFGTKPGEVWIAAPGGVYRLAWRDNRVVASANLDGTPGVHGVAVDRVGNRVLVSSVGRLQSALAEAAAAIAAGRRPARAPSVSQVTAFDAEASAPRGNGAADETKSVASTGSLGAFMAGAPAVAPRMNASGKRVGVAPLPANDRLVIFDAATLATIDTVHVGVLPVDAVISDDGTTAWVSVFGGPRPKPGELSATECCRALAERVRVTPAGRVPPGTVVQVDLVNRRVVRSVAAGLHPTGLAWDQKRARLFVANGNSDDISVIDTRAGTAAGTILLTPFKERETGIAPTALALSPDGNTLYVTLGGANAVAVVDVNGASATVAKVRGLIPTGWYPASIDVSADGATIAVGTLQGVGSGPGRVGQQTARAALAYRGSVNVIPVPTDAELMAYTTSVAQNNRLHLASGSAPATPVARRPTAVARAVPERPGEPSLIDHVVFIVRENRTYDQVFGDIGKGASDPSLVMYGRDVTPNAHALAERFVLLDHFFASGGNSADGHQWLTQANETEYPMWPLYFGRSYPSEADDALTYSSGGFLWEAAASKGKTVKIFGEYAPAPSDSIAAVRRKFLDEYRDRANHGPEYFRAQLKAMYNTRSDIPSLDKVLVREYPGWTQEIPDVVKADVFLEHLKEWEKAGTMPHLVMLLLPSDHTIGTSPGWTTPKANVADNDLALGRVVEGLTRSSFWKSMAILSVEDDAQNGVDHVDGHRTVALVASPYAKKGHIDATFYSQPSMVKTIELMLGLPAMSLFDLVATDMRASFIAPGEKPDLTPYTAVEPRQSIHEFNPSVGQIRGPNASNRQAAALASREMDFSQPDAAPSDLLNRILWHDARGWNVPFPGVRRSLFFPMALDLSDDEREPKKNPP